MASTQSLWRQRGGLKALWKGDVCQHMIWCNLRNEIYPLHNDMLLPFRPHDILYFFFFRRGTGLGIKIPPSFRFFTSCFLFPPLFSFPCWRSKKTKKNDQDVPCFSLLPASYLKLEENACSTISCFLWAFSSKEDHIECTYIVFSLSSLAFWLENIMGAHIL